MSGDSETFTRAKNVITNNNFNYKGTSWDAWLNGIRSLKLSGDFSRPLSEISNGFEWFQGTCSLRKWYFWSLLDLGNRKFSNIELKKQ